MAISQNDPDNWPHVVYAYDPDPRGKALTRTTFQWLTVTVDRVWWDKESPAVPGKSYGIKFVEDTDGDIWNLYGKFNEAINKSDAYEGYTYQPGEKVDAQLAMRTFTKNDGSPGVGRDITKIRINNEYSRVSPPAEEAPAAAPAAQQPVQQEPAPQPAQEPVKEPLLNTNQRIAKAQCLNIMKDFYLAGEIEVLGLTKEAAKQIFRDENLRLAQGKAVDLSYLSSLVQAAIEKGGTVVEVKDSNNPDEQVEELQW